MSIVLRYMQYISRNRNCLINKSVSGIFVKNNVLCLEQPMSINVEETGHNYEADTVNLLPLKLPSRTKTRFSNKSPTSNKKIGTFVDPGYIPKICWLIGEKVGQSRVYKKFCTILMAFVFVFKNEGRFKNTAKKKSNSTRRKRRGIW